MKDYVHTCLLEFEDQIHNMKVLGPWPRLIENTGTKKHFFMISSKKHFSI